MKILPLRTVLLVHEWSSPKSSREGIGGSIVAGPRVPSFWKVEGRRRTYTTEGRRRTYSLSFFSLYFFFCFGGKQTFLGKLQS
jgi:hypothetical protein